MRTLIGIVILGGIVGGLYALNRYTRDESGKSMLNVAGEIPVEVQCAKPVQRDIVKTVQAPGEVEAFLEVDISAEVVAKIIEMPVEEGDVVKKGDLLSRLDDADYRARLRQAQANVEKLKAAVLQGEADHEKADRDLKHQVGLSESDATSALELADYRTTAVRARAALEIRRQELIEAESLLEAAKEDLAKTVITSPIDGIVAQRFAKAGEVVITGTMNNPGTRIMVISDLSKMQVRCRVDESDVPSVKQGQPAKIFLQSDMYKGVPGQVYRVASKGTRATGRDVVTFETLILVETPEDRIKPGMNANVEIEVQRRDDALTIPVQAVVQRKRKDLPAKILEEFDAESAKNAEVTTSSEKRRQAEYMKVVFCNVRDRSQAKLVRTGISDETSVEITSGLKAEDWVVVGPFRSLDQLKHDSPVKKEEEDKNKAGAKKDEKAKSASEPAANANSNANGNSNDNAADAATVAEEKVASSTDGAPSP